MAVSSRVELLRLMPPLAEKWPVPDPNEIVRSYGSPLPSDFMWLAETYGPGAIARTLSIFPPLPAAVIGTRPVVFATEATVSEFEERNEGLDPAYLEPGALLMWGFNEYDDYAFWHRVGPPDKWPVVLFRYGAHHDAWLRYDFGIVEFLVRTFYGRLPQKPFSGEELWLNKAPTFERQ